jgi:flagellar FliJ protein
MQPVAHHAEQVEQDAIRVFVEAQQELANAERQLQQLLDYRDEYTGQLNGRSGLMMTQLHNFRDFVHKLDKAIKQARRDVEAHEQICERRRQEWLKTRSRSQALNKVVEKYQEQELKEQDQREQKEMDEHAQRLTQKTRKGY